MTVDDNEIIFNDETDIDAYIVTKQYNEDLNSWFITIEDQFEDYVVLSSEQAIQNCIEALEQTLRIGWLK